MTAETVLIEVVGIHGRVQARERIVLAGDARRFTIGRGAQADVTLDDAYVAAVHASVDITPEGKILVSDLGSVNGIVASGKCHRAVQNLELADGMFKIGHTRLRVRTASERLAPERPDQLQPASIMRNPAFIAVVGGLVCVGYVAYAGWLGAPRDIASTIVTMLISAGLAAGAWVAFWTLLSRVLQWEWRWMRHAAILFGVAAVLVSLDGLLELGWFALALPEWSMRTALTSAIAVGCALYLHLNHASNISPRRAALLAFIVPALAVGAGYWLMGRDQMRDVNHIGTTLRIYPPSLRLRSAGMAEDYFRDTSKLRAAADKKRQAMPGDDEEGGKVEADN